MLTLLGGLPTYSLTVAVFVVCREPWSQGTPLPLSRQLQCQRAGSWRLVQEEIHLACRAEYKGVRAEKEEPSQGVAPRKLLEGLQLRVVDGRSSRHAGRLVPGSLQAVAAAERLEAQPYCRAKQLLCEQTSQH